MKIQSDVTRTLSTDNAAPAKPASGASSPKATTAAQAVGSVNISEASRSLLASGTRDVEAPFDAQRVEAIKAAISAGQFRIDAEAIADKVIDSASQLVGKA